MSSLKLKYSTLRHLIMILSMSCGGVEMRQRIDGVSALQRCYVLTRSVAHPIPPALKVLCLLVIPYSSFYQSPISVKLSKVSLNSRGHLKICHLTLNGIIV